MTIPPRNRSTEFFVAGGTLKPNAPCYVQRPADDELLELVQAGHFAYVLTGRQMGKSSLIYKMAYLLKNQGVHTAIIDFTRIGTRISAEEWYLGLLHQLYQQLALVVQPQRWRQEQSWLGWSQCFINFLAHVVLKELEGEVVIFVDEIDRTLNLGFSDDFFVAIRALYNARAQEPTFDRLTFVLSGVATPTDLIKERTQTPFDIGQGVLLQDFSLSEAKHLQVGLQKQYPIQAEPIFTRIYHWTDGHPYLTQKLCQEIIKYKRKKWTDEQIDKLVREIFLSDNTLLQEQNIQNTQGRILNLPQKSRLLKLYRRVYQGQKVTDNPQSFLQTQLKLSGLVKVGSERHLQVRNRIYRHKFNFAWLKKNLPSAREQYFGFSGVDRVLEADDPSYIERPADNKLFDLIRAGQFAYVLASRQMGKSSLIIRTAYRLEQVGVHTTAIDFTIANWPTLEEEWYLFLIEKLANQLDLSIDPKEWWQKQTTLDTTTRFIDFLQHIVLTEIEEQIVIFIDGIDYVQVLKFCDDFFIAIRAIVDARAQNPAFKRLTFVLSGMDLVFDLTKDDHQRPFSIGHRIVLQDFTRTNVTMLKVKLAEIFPNQGTTIFERIYYWTNGHPYLTQKMCRAVMQTEKENCSDEQVDELVSKQFLLQKSRVEDPNLYSVQDAILGHPQSQRLVRLYRKVHEGQEVRDDPHSSLQKQLRLSGIVRVDKGRLYVRNQIYRQVFDLEWIEAHTVIDLPRWLTAILIAIIIFVSFIIAKLIN